MCYDQKRGRRASGGPWCESVAVVGLGCQKPPSPDAQRYLCKPTAAGPATPLAPCARGDGGEELRRTCSWLWAEESCSLLLFALTAINIPSPRLLDRVISAEID